MPIVGKPKSLYRPILRSALHHVLIKRDVWLFGIFALVFGSGSALETVIRARNGIEQAGAPFFSRLIPSLEAPRQWLAQIDTLSPVRASLTITIAIVLFIALVWMAILSQSVIVSGGKPHKSKKHLWRILAVNVLLKGGLAIAILMLLAPLLITTPIISEAILFLQAIVSYGLIFTFTLLAIYAIAEIVNHAASLPSALRSAWRVFADHPMASLETSLLLFFLNLLAGLAALAALLLLSLPYTFFYLLAANAGSFLATSLTTAITFFVVMAVLVVLGGFTTAYNYTVLAMVYEKLRSGRFTSKWHRVIRTGHWF